MEEIKQTLSCFMAKVNKQISDYMLYIDNMIAKMLNREKEIDADIQEVHEIHSELQGLSDELTNHLHGFTVIGDVTLTEDANTVRFSEDKNGNPVSDYKDFFLYFAGTFNDDTNGNVMVASDNSYWRFVKYPMAQSSGSEQTFWCFIQEVATISNYIMRLCVYPDSFLSQGGVSLIASGSETNKPLISNFTSRSKSRKLADLYFTVKDVNTIKSGSRVILLGRK